MRLQNVTVPTAGLRRDPGVAPLHQPETLQDRAAVRAPRFRIVDPVLAHADIRVKSLFVFQRVPQAHVFLPRGFGQHLNDQHRWAVEVHMEGAHGAARRVQMQIGADVRGRPSLIRIHVDVQTDRERIPRQTEIEQARANEPSQQRARVAVDQAGAQGRTRLGIQVRIRDTGMDGGRAPRAGIQWRYGPRNGHCGDRHTVRLLVIVHHGVANAAGMIYPAGLDAKGAAGLVPIVSAEGQGGAAFLSRAVHAEVRNAAFSPLRYRHPCQGAPF